MAYQSMDRPRYVVPALGSVYSAIEVYSWPLVRAATGFFFLPHGMQKLFGFWGGDIARTATVLPSKG
jgi:putative oxidoreductase